MPRIKLTGDTQRAYAHRSIDAAPEGTVVSILQSGRTNDQNAKMWAMLEDVRRTEPEGRQWTRDSWKSAFMHFLGHEVEFGQSLDGKGFFPLGHKSSQLSKKAFSDLIECIYEYGARHSVEWRETDRSGYDATRFDEK